ncbi:unnamed protein product [Lota lota]
MWKLRRARTGDALSFDELTVGDEARVSKVTSKRVERVTRAVSRSKSSRAAAGQAQSCARSTVSARRSLRSRARAHRATRSREQQEVTTFSTTHRAPHDDHPTTHTGPATADTTPPDHHHRTHHGYPPPTGKQNTTDHQRDHHTITHRTPPADQHRDHTNTHHSTGPPIVTLQRSSTHHRQHPTVGPNRPGPQTPLSTTNHRLPETHHHHHDTTLTSGLPRGPPLGRTTTHATRLTQTSTTGPTTTDHHRTTYRTTTHHRTSVLLVQDLRAPAPGPGPGPPWSRSSEDLRAPLKTRSTEVLVLDQEHHRSAVRPMAESITLGLAY